MDFFRGIKRQLRGSPGPSIQIVSDLHLEVGQQYSTYSFPSSAPFLLLAGDIGRLIDYDGYLVFLEAQMSRYKGVFLVLGNHEFYGVTYEAGLERARRLAAEPAVSKKLVLLHRERWDDPDSDLSIAGCTLWSAIPEDIYGVVQSKVKDYQQIDGWSPAKHNEIHAEEITWLRSQVAELQGTGAERRRLLIATHYAPCIEGTSSPEHTANPWTPAFATDIIPREGWTGSEVRTWVYGHTHYSTDFLLNGVRVIANQRGYVLPGSSREEDERRTKRRGKHEFDAVRTITIQ